MDLHYLQSHQAVLGLSTSRGKEDHKETKVKNPHSLPDKVPGIQYTQILTKVQKLS